MCKMGIIIGPNLSVGRKIKLTIWGNITVLAKRECVRAKLLQLCPALCDPMDCSLPGSSVHGISQARILEWVAFPSPGDLPRPGVEPRSPVLQAESLPLEPPGKQKKPNYFPKAAHPNTTILGVRTLTYE